MLTLLMRFSALIDVHLQLLFFLCILYNEQAMLSAIKTNNPVAVFIGFAIFFSVTFGVLLCMDVLECFLHALRLHWVS
jgi:V-type H+-transporting ATPase subunit a